MDEKNGAGHPGMLAHSLSLPPILLCEEAAPPLLPSFRLHTLNPCTQVFDHPEVVAAKMLGLSLITVKRLCRSLGISRWPNRKFGCLRCVRVCRSVHVYMCMTVCAHLHVFARPPCLFWQRASEGEKKRKRIGGECRHALFLSAQTDSSSGKSMQHRRRLMHLLPLLRLSGNWSTAYS